MKNGIDYKNYFGQDTQYFYKAILLDNEFAFAYYYLAISLIRADKNSNTIFNLKVIHYFRRAMDIMKKNNENLYYSNIEEALRNYYNLFPDQPDLEKEVNKISHDYLFTDKNENYSKVKIETDYEPILFQKANNYIGFSVSKPYDVVESIVSKLKKNNINYEFIMYSNNNHLSKVLDNIENYVFIIDEIIFEILHSSNQDGNEIAKWLRKEGDGVSHFKFKLGNEKIYSAQENAGIYFDLRPQFPDYLEKYLAMSKVWSEDLSNNEKCNNWIDKLIIFFKFIDENEELF
jgi:hypothetical protein